MVETRQILAMGGGGFSMEPDNPLLDRYVLSLAKAARPKVCFIPTASGDAEGYISRFYAAFEKLEAEPSHLPLFKGNLADPRAHLLRQDVLYVGGGNTRNMLVLWKEHGLDVAPKEAWEAGVVLAGLSAGALCWFEEGVTDSSGTLGPLRGLGFLPGSYCPHYDGEAERRPAYLRLVEGGALGAGYAADDGVGLHFIGTALTAVVASRPDARAYRVAPGAHGAEEEVLVPRYLA